MFVSLGDKLRRSDVPEDPTESSCGKTATAKPIYQCPCYETCSRHRHMVIRDADH